MSTKKDIIIIGAGMGGLSAAAYLAKQGKNVLLLEQHNIAGGYATSFIRGRFEFEVSLHELSGAGTAKNPGPLYHYFDQLGITKKIELLGIPDLYRTVYPDVDITLPVGWEPFTQALVDAFPHEEKGIKSFLGGVKKVNDQFKPFTKMIVRGETPPVSDFSKGIWQARSQAKNKFATWSSVLNKAIKDVKLRAIISQFWGYFGLPPAMMAYEYFATALAGYIEFGPSYINSRSQGLSAAFVEVIEENGGEVRYNCKVKKIKTENQKVIGVETEQGEEIFSDFIVSNADPIATGYKLIGRENLPKSFIASTEKTTVAMSSFNVYLGLSKSPEELGLHDHEIFVNNGYDHDKYYEDLKEIAEPEEVAITCYNAVMPDISPPGTSMVVICVLMYGEPWHSVDPHEYVDVKNRIAEAMLKMTDKVYPKIRDAIEEIEVSTPITNMRYTGVLGGSIYGSNQHPWNASILRMPQKGPLENLYLTGAWTQPGGGYEPSIYSGRFAGDLILREYSKRKAN